MKSTIQIDFTEEELAFIDAYAAYTGEERDVMLQRILQQVIKELKEQYKKEKQFMSK